MGEHKHAELDNGADTLGRALRDLHEALSDFAGELGDLLDVQHDIERLHRQLRPTEALSPELIDCLRGRLLALSAPVFAARRALDAYGWADERDLAPFMDAHALYGEIWQLYVVQRQL